MVAFVSKRYLARSLMLNGDTLKKYRQQGDWLEGIHWVQINSRCIRYNLELIQDWLYNRNDPASHRRAIERYQSSLLSNQKKASKKNI
jgi:hypothetical protein